MGCICGCTTGIVRTLLFVANVLFMLSGVAIAAVGIKVNSTFMTYETLFQGAFTAAALSVIVVGAVIGVVGFCGCCGAIQRSVCLLQTYAVLLLCVFVTELSIGIVALTQVSEVEVFMQERLDAFFIEEYQDDGASELFDVVQKKFECCGVNGTGDYYNLGVAIPVSCCDKHNVTICSPALAYAGGCRDDVTDYVAGSIFVVGVVTLCVASIAVFAVMFACCLAVRYSDKRRLRQ